ncbi:hypothetical protein FNF29_05036 [Cafeteria roenbergensis]|uniref:PH domain-containing protein n=1 Tax=Cafeteria roenbergensis TaxID=33653 RepID=A0A5A8CDF9_CAFRO|nr:hypothetical protein FNF29_05036 [Cafeteria roenbergensis]|eukprot:KAA0150699.1 hypothetical protein FNF29_05036 [Cafeteria roenbergensis]
MEGFLWKKGERGMVKGFKRRWFVLERSGRLRYFDDASLAKEHGDVDVTRATRVSRGNPAKVRGGAKAFSANVFELEVPGRAYTLIPEQPGALADWVGALASCVDLSSFRGDLRGIAESALSRSAAATTAMVAVPDSPPGPAPPRGPPPPPSPPSPDHYESRAAAAASSEPASGGWGKSRKNSVAAARGRHADEDQAVVGAGRTGGGFFSRMGGSSTGGSVAAPARLRDLEARHAETQDEVATLKQELASLRRERAASSGKGRGELGESLLGSSSRSRRASSAAGDWGDDDDEPEVLPGCACCGGRCTCKVFFLVMVNILVIATGAGVAAAGAYGLVKKSSFAKIIPELGMYVLLGVGLGFVAVGALGSFGATRFTKASGKMLLLIYVICMSILTTAELGGSVFLIVDVEGIKLPSEANAAEQQLEVFFNNVYHSCCNTTVDERNGPGCVWVPADVTSGCPNITEHAFSQRISTLIKSELLPVGGAAAGLVVIHAAAAWFALTLVCPCCCCCCRKKKGKGDPGEGSSRDRSRSRSGSTASRRRRQSAYDDDLED